MVFVFHQGIGEGTELMGRIVWWW